MKKSVKNFIKKEDWKKFNLWIEYEKLFFFNNNFYTKFCNIIFKTNYQRNFWEFFVYNKLILEDKYDFYQKLLPKQLLVLKEQFSSETINKCFEVILTAHIQNENINFQQLFFFLDKLHFYLNKGVKDFKEEYDLLKIYWDYLEWLITNHIKDFNDFIIYLNKNIYFKQKGFM